MFVCYKRNFCEAVELLRLLLSTGCWYRLHNNLYANLMQLL